MGGAGLLLSVDLFAEPFPCKVFGLGAIVGVCAWAVAIVFHAGVFVVCSRREVSAIGSRASVLNIGTDALDAAGGAECMSFAMFWLTADEVLGRTDVDLRVGMERLRVLLT